jgi:hypothetical protein
MREAAAVVVGEAGGVRRRHRAARCRREAGDDSRRRALVPAAGRPRRDVERAAVEVDRVAARFAARREHDAGLVFLDADPRQPEREPTAPLVRAERSPSAGRDRRASSPPRSRRRMRDDEPAIVRAGDEARFLAPLPLARLTPEVDLAGTLQRWGIATIGELARLPAAEVASRLGDAGRALHSVARGVDPRPLVPHEPPRDLRVGLELDWPLATLEPFLVLAKTALDRLCRRLERGARLRALGIGLTLEPDGTTNA